MKHYLIPIVLFVVLIFSSCSKDVITNPGTSSSSQGSVSLKMNKNTAPGNAVTVVAYLYRTNYDTLSENMNLLNDTSADILFQNIPAGDWHLKVNVLDSTQTVIYTGETDVSISAGITTQVSLTLVPTGQGTGSVEITVNWGQQNSSQWIDYNTNPIYTRYESPTLPNGVGEAIVMMYQNKYRMWYINLYNSAVTNIWYAESSDGYNWKSVVTSPVLTVGEAGSWDDFKVAVGAVVRDDSVFKMYYTGMRNEYGAWQIGLATSSDGINWEKYPNPVLDSTSAQVEVAVHSVLKVNGKYYMYYDVPSLPNTSIFLATSEDGIHWERYSPNPILTNTQEWENGGVSYPSVIYDNGEFKMIYDTKYHSGFGYATSSDGINWTKSKSNPVFTVGYISNNWTYKVAYPFFSKFGNQYRLYYTGSINSYEIEIGVAFTSSNVN